MSADDKDPSLQNFLEAERVVKEALVKHILAIHSVHPELALNLMNIRHCLAYGAMMKAKQVHEEKT